MELLFVDNLPPHVLNTYPMAENSLLMGFASSQLCAFLCHTLDLNYPSFRFSCQIPTYKNITGI